MNNVEKVNFVRIVPDKLVGLACPQARLVEKHRLWDGLTFRGGGVFGGGRGGRGRGGGRGSGSNLIGNHIHLKNWSYWNL